MGKGTVLELGCGDGNFERYVDGVYYGIDLKKKRDKDIELDITKNKLPFENKSMDYIVALEVFEHLSDFTSVLNEIRRVVKKEGLLIITVPGCYRLNKIIKSFLGVKTDSSEHVVSFSRTTIKNLLREHDFYVEEIGFLKGREYMYVIAVVNNVPH